MIIKSNNKIIELIRLIGQRVQAFQDATDEVDEAVGKRLGLNRRDLRCLSVLSRRGPMSAAALAEASGLTRGAMTTAIDRLEAVGFARRVWDQEDRRSVRIEITAEATQAIERLYGPLAQEGFQLLQQYSEIELVGVARYLQDGWELQRTQAQRIRALKETRGGAGRIGTKVRRRSVRD